jgi:Ca2+-binding RTX toxin-like protein
MLATRARSRRLIGAVVLATALVSACLTGPVLGSAKVLTCQGKPVTMQGTGGPDTITGTSGDDVISTLEGDDVVVGGAGNDTICTGGGNDTAVGDFMDAITAKDLRRGKGMVYPAPLVGSGDDSIQTGTGDDVAVGDVFRTFARKLTVLSCRKQLKRAVARGIGSDRLDTGPGDDLSVGDAFLAIGYLSCIKASGSGDDYFSAEGNADRVMGDVMFRIKRAKKAVLKSRLKRLCLLREICMAIGTGNDEFHGRTGPDYIVGDSYAEKGTALGTGDDSANGDSGNDELIGDSASKLAAVAGGADNLAGNTGADWMTGDAYGSGVDDDKTAAPGATEGGGPDKLIGGGGPDMFDAGPKQDKCSGGGGHDKDLSKPPCENASGIP